MKRVIDSAGNVEEDLTPREARQGRQGRPVLYVLVAGLVLAGIVMAIVMLWSNATDTVPNAATKGVSSVMSPAKAA